MAQLTTCHAVPRIAAKVTSSARPAMLNTSPMPWVRLLASSIFQSENSVCGFGCIGNKYKCTCRFWVCITQVGREKDGYGKTREKLLERCNETKSGSLATGRRLRRPVRTRCQT